MHPRTRTWTTFAVSLCALVGALSACSKSDGSDPERTGPVAQAVEELRDYGLTADQAECVVGKVGADAVVEATDLTAFTDSQQYRDAAKACIDGN